MLLQFKQRVSNDQGGAVMDNEDYKASRRKWGGLALLLILSTLLVLLFVFVLPNISKNLPKPKDIGLIAVNSLYDFSNLAELDDNMDVLRSVTTDKVYEMLTIDRTDRALSVYLKFNNKPTIVLPETVTDSYIIYSLKTDSINAGRKFVFFYSVNEDGKIDTVREAEIVDFSTND